MFLVLGYLPKISLYSPSSSINRLKLQKKTFLDLLAIIMLVGYMVLTVYSPQTMGTVLKLELYYPQNLKKKTQNIKYNSKSFNIGYKLHLKTS